MEHGPLPVIGKTSTLPLTVYCPVISSGFEKLILPFVLKLSTSTFKASITALVKPMILTSFNFKSILTALLEPFPCSISNDGNSNGSIAGILSFGYPSAKSGMTDWMEVFKHLSRFGSLFLHKLKAISVIKNNYKNIKKSKAYNNTNI